jgi:MoaA/NifB/PqqE/SkfB family radical SAM enzyme
MWRAGANLIRHAVGTRLGREPLGRPLFAYLYVTYRCDLACSYCDDGTGRPYPARRVARELDTAEVLQLLALLRRETDGLIITGGEPLRRPDLEEILAGARSLGFSPIVLYTNGHTLDERLGVLAEADLVMVSLDTLDEAAADRLYGRGAGVARRVRRNIEQAAALQDRLGFRLYFNICIMPQTLPGLDALLDYALEGDVGFAALPQLRAAYAAPELVGDARYIALVDRIIALKRQGFPVMGSLLYLEGIRDFRRFRCLPSLLVRVRPDGHVVYPCNKIDGDAGDLLELGSCAAALRQGAARLGPPPRCDARCHDSCYMDSSLCVQRPALLLSEGYLRLKGWVRSRLRGAAINKRPSATIDARP